MKIKGISSEDVKKALMRGEVTLAIYGLGKLGLPLALIFANKGANVIGVDINPKIVEKINSGISPLPFEPGVDELLSRAIKEGKFKATVDGEEAAKQSDVMIIVVPVMTDSTGRPELSHIKEAVLTISKGLSKGDIVITETTLPPGTTLSFGKLLEKNTGLRLGKDFGIAHAPERTMSGRMIKDITSSYPKVIGASDQETLDAVKGLYEAINEKGVIETSNPTVAEAVKVFEGVYRDVNIALANELALYSELIGFDVIEAIKVANTQPYSHIHLPGAGVGGHCIPIYPYFLIETAKQKGLNMKLLKTAREINEAMPLHIVYMIIKALNEIGKPIRDSRILILGLTYRSGVKELYNSPALTIIKELKDMKAQVYAYDPLISEDETYKIGAHPWRNEPVDVVVIVNEYETFRNMIYDNVIKVNAIVDAKRLIDPRRVKDMGIKYWGVGFPRYR